MTSLRFDQRTITRVFVCFGAILTILALPTPSLGADAKSLRVRAWDQCLDSANSVPAVRYSLYAYRSLAVQHPEIYLEADQLISEVLEDLPGSRLAYRSRDVRDVEPAVSRRHRGRGHTLGEREAEPVGVVVDDVKIVSPPVRLAEFKDCRRHEVRSLRVKSQRPRHAGDQVRGRHRVTAGEKRNIVPPAHQLLG